MNDATEVTATIGTGLSQDDLDEMNEAERLALIVGAAYGRALADRDMIQDTLTEALDHLDAVISNAAPTSFAHTNAAVDAALEFIQRIRTDSPPVDSEQTPTQED